MVETNVRQSIIYPDQPGCNYITVRGFIIRQAATPWDGAMSEQVGLLGTHWSKGWIIENNLISHSMNTGITLGRYDLEKWGMAKPTATAEGFVSSCELAIEHGWSKEKIGSHIVRNNQISHCEKNGIHGGLGGIWLDWMAQGRRVTGNLLHDNKQVDLFMEVNHGPFLIDHNLFLSLHSIRDWSQGSAYAHNLIAGSFVSRQQERETPYFSPHTVEDMKLSSIHHKDVRYYKNLLTGKSGLPAKDKAGNLQADGNVHLRDVDIRLEEKEDQLWITVPQDPDAKKRTLVTTERLGKASIPDATFENPDGTPYRLNTDYFGKKHNEENPPAGPFAIQTGQITQLKV
jgi:alpha-N-arabinofuranosidase